MPVSNQLIPAGYFGHRVTADTVGAWLPVESGTMWRGTGLGVVLALCLAGCAGMPKPAHADATAAMQGDGARPSHADGWVRSELYFGVGKEGEPTSEIGQARWREFLDQEVTRRFPDGLTVLNAYGQWLFRGREGPERLDSKVLIILHEDTAERNADIQAIRLAWKRTTGHQSVLWSRHAVHVSF